MARSRRWWRRPRSVPRPADLTEALGALAGCPCDAHRAALLAVFAATEQLLFAVADSDRPISGSGQHRIAPDRRVALQTVGSGDRRLLLAFPDEPSALRHDREAPYAGLAVAAAASWVLEDPEVDGLLLTTGGEDGNWVVIGRHQLQNLLAGT